jgi:hypothetical protein
MDDVQEILSRTRARLSDGEIDQATVLARDRDTRTVRDSDLHLAWADLLEELGLMDEVILELNLAIRDDPERLEIYPRLAEVLLDQGQAHRAARVWEALVKREPQEPRWYEGLATALKEAKDFAQAREVYTAALAQTGDVRFKAMLKDMGFLGGEEQVREDVEHPEQIAPQQHHLVTFTSLFAGREGSYARQWVSPTGESGYTPVEEPLSLRVAENHIAGNYTIGVYPVRLDNTVNFIAFDFDVAKFAVNKAITSERAWNSVMGKVHAVACRLMDEAAANDIPVYLEDSGFKGRHAWIFLETPVQAGVAKRFGETLVSRLSPIPSEVTVEVFPKQASVRKGGLGNLIKLPLGIHRRTGKRALFIEPSGEAVADQLNLLETVSRANRRQIYGLIQRLHAAPTPAVASPTHESVESMPEPAREPELPVSHEEYNLDLDTQFQFLVSKCAVVRAIVDSANRTSMLSRDETQVLIHTLGHLDRGPDAVNEIFRRCVNADLSLMLKSRLRGNPMSCPKIRTRVPELTSRVPCNCVFDLSVNLYPTPLIHVTSVSRARSVAPIGLTVESLQFQNLVQDYIKLRKQLRETQLLLQRYEEQLMKFFDEAGVQSAQTPTGKLSICRHDDGKVTFTLDI